MSLLTKHASLAMSILITITGAILAAVVVSTATAHDDSGADKSSSAAEASQANAPSTLEMYRTTLESYYSPCAEIIRIIETGEESGDLRELGFLEPVPGLPEISNSRFQRCGSNRLTGEAALSFVINDDLVLVLSNSDVERESLINELGLNDVAIWLPVDIGMHHDVVASIHGMDSDVIPDTGSSSFSINDLRTQ